MEKVLIIRRIQREESVSGDLCKKKEPHRRKAVQPQIINESHIKYFWR